MSKKKGNSLPAKAFKKLSVTEEENDDKVLEQEIEQSFKKRGTAPKLKNFQEQKTEANTFSKQNTAKRQDKIRKKHPDKSDEVFQTQSENDSFFMKGVQKTLDLLPLVEWAPVTNDILNFEEIKNVF